VVQLLALRRANAELEMLTRAQHTRQQALEEHERQLQEENHELAEQTLTDALTNLKNRRAFDRILSNEYARSLRARSGLALLMVDVDHFKAYNDQYGHQAGDVALQAVAGAIKSQARAYDPVTVSVGGAMADPNASPAALVERADQALYQAKQNGRNRVHTSL